jgi:hypothetical protein
MVSGSSSSSWESPDPNSYRDRKSVGLITPKSAEDDYIIALIVCKCKQWRKCKAYKFSPCGRDDKQEMHDKKEKYDKKKSITKRETMRKSYRTGNPLLTETQ